MRLFFFFMIAYVSVFSSNVWSIDKTTRVVGTNLEGITDYSGDWPFLNRMKSTRKWITFDSTGKDTTWDTNIPIPSDKNGYPLRVPFDPDGYGGISPQGVRTILINENNHYPVGTYTLIFEGKGKLHLRVDAQCPMLRNGQCIFDKPNVLHHFFVKKPTKGGLRLKILSSEVGDHIRNIRIFPPTVNNTEQNKFHPTYLARVQGFKILRFMDWASVNHSKIKSWSERVQPDYYTYTIKGRGVPYEVMLNLSNHISADPWVVIPTMANDDFVEKLATLIADRLNKNRTVYLEYSNEIWNTIFPQNRFANKAGARLGRDLGLSLNKKDANALFYARRSAEVFEIFEKVLKGKHKLVKIVSGQGMNPSVARKVIKWLNDPKVNPNKVKADALAIALYFGAGAVDDLLTAGGRRDKRTVTVDDVKAITVDALLDKAAEALHKHRKPRMIEHRELASHHGMKLLAYEGGQSMRVGPGFSGPVVHAAASKFIEANRSERMGALYREMFDLWFGHGGDAFMNFSYIYRPNRWGAWGVLEHQWQNPDEAPKYRAVKEQLNLGK